MTDDVTERSPLSPAHGFGTTAAGLAQALDEATFLAHSAHARIGETYRTCTASMFCRDAGRLIAAMETSAGRGVTEVDFAEQLAGYAEGVATCVLRHSKMNA